MISKKLPLLVQVNLSNSLFLPKCHFHIHLKPPRSNQSLKKYLDCNRPSKVLQLFRYLLTERASSIDSFSFLFVLKACSHKKHSTFFGNLIQGLNRDLTLNNALINMYAKCGDISAARRLFDSTRNKDVTTWTSMIVGHALHGQA
ncbi:hypothetical protein K1719_002121 [Acacia pycnantha]|nr:hypothetical protein K1719_002121 [Acacia pycnantha]